MNINPSAAASVAGTSRASARGGESDNQAAESTRQQSRTEAPAGSTGESTVEANDQTTDRDANGRQLYDTFESSEPEQENQEETGQENPPRNTATEDGKGNALDVEA